MSKQKRYCLQCDDGTVLRHAARDMTGEVDGIPFTIKAVRGWHCAVCGDCEFDAGEGARYNAELERANERATRTRAEEIRTLRKTLKLTQAEAAELFGGGINAFSEYERGKTRPHKSTVLLLRLLAKNPVLLGTVKPGGAARKSVTSHVRSGKGKRTMPATRNAGLNA